jgi:hypothetical protein
MRVFPARVRGGTLVPEGDHGLPEGATVTVIADSGEPSFEATAEEEAELLLAIDEVERGEVVRAADLLSRLHR